jgi:hypothetical protein
MVELIIKAIPTENLERLARSLEEEFDLRLSTEVAEDAPPDAGDNQAGAESDGETEPVNNTAHEKGGER